MKFNRYCLASGVALAVLLAACAGYGAPSSAPPLSVQSGAVSAGVPLKPQIDAKVVGAKSPTNIYVSNEEGNSVAVFSSKGASLRTVTSGVRLPSSVALDGSGRLYVANYSGSITIYAKDSNTLVGTITSHVAKPKHIIFDNAGTLYGSMSRWIQVYPGGETAKTYRIYPGGGPIAVDSNDTLYVAEYAAMAIYAKGTKHKPRKIAVNGNITALAVDADGEVYVGETNVMSGPCKSDVAVYDSASGKLLRTITQEICTPSSISFDTQQNAYIANVAREGSYVQSVTEFAAGTTTLLRQITNGSSDPVSIAMHSNDGLYVANNLQNSVSIYAPGKNVPTKVITKNLSGPSTIIVGP